MPGSHGWRYRRLLAILLVVMMVSAGCVLFRASLLPSRGAAPIREGLPPVVVDAVTIRRVLVQPSSTVSGEVEPYRVATISSEVSGRILARPFESGSAVRGGTILAVIDPSTPAAALRRATAGRVGATAVRRQAEVSYEQAAIETGAAREEAAANLAVAQRTVQQLELEYDHARVENQYTSEEARSRLVSAIAAAHKAHALTRGQELKQAQAALQQAKAAEHLAQIEAARYGQLVQQGAIAQQVLDHARADLEAARAQRESAEQAISLATEGSREEDIQTADAGVVSARAALREAEAGGIHLAALSQQLAGAREQVLNAAVALRRASTGPLDLAALRQQIQSLRAGETAASARSSAAQILLTRYRITAPFAGRILRALANAGDMAAPGTPIARLGDISRVKIALSVPERVRPTLCLGRLLPVTADAFPGQRFYGRISSLDSQADPATRAFRLEITVPNPDERLLPNMVTRVEIPTGPPTAQLLAPLGAVSVDGDDCCVFVLQAGAAHRRRVAIGEPVGGFAEVRSGLWPGAIIAATPQRLTDGEPVQVLSAGKTLPP